MLLHRMRDRVRRTATSEVVLRVGGLLTALAVLATDYLVVRATGGTPNPLVHFAYLGIIVAAVAAGSVGAVAGGLLAGLMLGPLMPDSTAASSTFLGDWGWSFRLVAYIAAGLLVSACWRWAQRMGRIDSRRQEAREIVNLAAGEATSLVACQRLRAACAADSERRARRRPRTFPCGTLVPARNEWGYSRLSPVSSIMPGSLDGVTKQAHDRPTHRTDVLNP